MPTVLPIGTPLLVNNSPVLRAGEGDIRLYSFPPHVTVADLMIVFELKEGEVLLTRDRKDQIAFKVETPSGIKVFVLESDELDTKGQWALAKPGDKIQVGDLQGTVIWADDEWSETEKNTAMYQQQ